MRLIGYCRVSTRTQLDGTSLDSQRKAIRAWCRAEGHRLVRIETDGAVSGTKPAEERDGLLAVLEGIRDHEADGAVMQNLDRFARELHVQEGTLATIWRHGGRVFAYESGEVLADDPKDPYRTAMRQMAGVFAQLERNLIVKRLRTGRKAKAAAGGFAYGAPAYGQQAVDKVLVEKPAEQATITRIRELHAAGASLREMAATLTAEGHRPKRADRWHPQSLARILARQ